MPNYDDQPKLDFSIFANQYAKTDKHPGMTGTIEFTRPFLKALVEEAKSGTMPKVKVASWERTGRESGKPYQYMRMELAQTGDSATPAPAEEAFLLRLEKVLLNKVRREAQNREITVTDMFVEMVESYDYNQQQQPLVKPKSTRWWEKR